MAAATTGIEHSAPMLVVYPLSTEIHIEHTERRPLLLPLFPMVFALDLWRASRSRPLHAVETWISTGGHERVIFMHRERPRQDPRAAAALSGSTMSTRRPRMGCQLTVTRYTVKRRLRSTPTQPVVSPIRGSSASHAPLHPSAMFSADSTRGWDSLTSSTRPFYRARSQ